MVKKKRLFLALELISAKDDPTDELISDFTRCIDYEELHGYDLTIAGITIIDSIPSDNESKYQELRKKTNSKAINGIKEKFSAAPGILGTFYNFLKNFKWWQIYIGFAGVILVGSLLSKWFIRALRYLF
jgi:hypothetical protein